MTTEGDRSEIAVTSQNGNELLNSHGKRAHEFTSENYKCLINNLPKKIKFYQVQQLVNSFKLKPHKIRIGEGRAYLAFTTERERNEAIEKLDQQEWRDRLLSATPAEPRQDPFAKKLRDDVNKTVESEDVVYDDDAINKQVCPFWNRQYDEQLRFKESTIKTLIDISKPLLKLCPDLKKDAPKLFEWCRDENRTSFDGIEPSPVLIGYRNKCELNVGHDSIIGFKMGRYKNGSERVVPPPKNCPILNQHMFNICEIFQKHLDNKELTKLKGFNQVTHEGHVRQLTIRTNQNNECLIIVDFHPQDLTKDEVDQEIEHLINNFIEFKNIISIYVNISERNHLTTADQTMKLVYGQNYLYEQLTIDPQSPLKFRIGPTSFFQVNTRAAEILYKSIIDVAELNSKSLVLDVGCGTGTIGLSLARRVSYVIGIEIVESAVQDAKVNAEENKISNVSFFAGKAEELIGECIGILKSKLNEQNDEGEIVAIVDPPRVGFNNSFIKTIRASNIRKIIYVACDPKANTNLVTLCRPKSKAYQGEPFVPIRAKAFDLFPHTKFCELVMVYERLERP